MAKEVSERLFPRISKKKICDALEVSRASLYWNSKKTMENKMIRYKKSEDEFLLTEILKFLKSRPTYGYKRITALLNKERLRQGFSLYNKKRIYRIMEINGLLLPKTEKTREHKKNRKSRNSFF